jgi:dTDP-4-amino-4,6-dideoxygalactose transaminase
VTVVARGEEPGGQHADEAPEGSWAVPLSAILVDAEIERAVVEVLRSGWWSMGPRVAELEREFADFCGAETALAVTNGTAALHLALLAVGCGPGDEVLLPSLNFVAAANAIGHVGADPVFCDVEGPDNLNIDPGDIEAAVGPATRAVVVMHYGGYPCRMDAVLEVAARHGLAVIEDAAHAPGASWRGRMCGTIGDVGCFSFFSNKNMPTGEGGMVVTSDETVAERIRLLRSHGMTALTWDRHRGHAQGYDVVASGLNYRFDELRAAIGLVQLRRLPERNASRGEIVTRYRAELDGVRGITMPFAPDRETTAAYHLAVLVLPAGLSREDFRASLAAQRIQTSVHYPPIHTLSRYHELGTRRPLAATDAVAERLVTLPLYPHMRDDQVEAVISAVLAAV